MNSSGGVTQNYTQKLLIKLENSKKEIKQYISIAQTGRIGKSGVFQIGEKRQCSARFEFTESWSGSWEMSCNDQATANGRFTLDDKTKVTLGTGSTSFGGDVTFKMERL